MIVLLLQSLELGLQTLHVEVGGLFLLVPLLPQFLLDLHLFGKFPVGLFQLVVVLMGFVELQLERVGGLGGEEFAVELVEEGEGGSGVGLALFLLGTGRSERAVLLCEHFSYKIY